MGNTFRFKKFEVTHGRSSMKVNTDGVLLGAWARLHEAKNILDIGTGCGVIALMAAQQNETANIVGIDIDGPSITDAIENGNHCPWSQRVAFLHTSLQELARTSSVKYDHILSNPPYFDGGTLPTERSVSARHQSELSLEELDNGVMSLLSDHGAFSFILPVAEATQIIDASTLHLRRLCKVYIRPHKLGRFLVTLSKVNGHLTEESLLIRRADSTYSEEYKAITKDFYLNF